jgi:hypothetical protein
MKRKDGSVVKAIVKIKETTSSDHLPVFIWNFDEVVQQTCQLKLDEKV